MKYRNEKTLRQFKRIKGGCVAATLLAVVGCNSSSNARKTAEASKTEAQTSYDTHSSAPAESAMPVPPSEIRDVAVKGNTSDNDQASADAGSAESDGTKQIYGFIDFWNVGGVVPGDSAADVIKKWGPPDERTEETGRLGAEKEVLRYADGVVLTFSATGGILFDFGTFDSTFKKNTAGPIASITGRPCGAAAAVLDFAESLGPYTTCKHYDKNGWFLDVTVMCRETVGTIAVMWEPIPKSILAQKLPDDRCL